MNKRVALGAVKAYSINHRFAGVRINHLADTEQWRAARTESSSA